MLREIYYYVIVISSCAKKGVTFGVVVIECWKKLRII